MAYAPVALFSYKRADKLEKCLSALEKDPIAKETDLYLFADGSKSAADSDKVKEVRCFIHNYLKKSTFHKVVLIEREKNLGLANSIIGGVTQVINEHNRVIVVEDDLIVQNEFLSYMNSALDYYEGMKEYGSISAYTYPLPELEEYDKDIYVTHKGECWGWGTWSDRWNGVDWAVSDFGSYRKDRKKRKAFDAVEKGLDRMLILQKAGKIDSWAVRWCYHLFTHQLLTVYPRISRAQNIGFDGSGTNCGDIKSDEERYAQNHLVAADSSNSSVFFERMPVDIELERKAATYMYVPFGEKIINIFKNIFKYLFIKRGIKNETGI